jgi:hypothetical protein
VGQLFERVLVTDEEPFRRGVLGDTHGLLDLVVAYDDASFALPLDLVHDR